MTMKAKYRDRLAAIGLGALALAGCSDEWDDHYGPEGAAASQTLMQLIEADGQCSRFAEAVKAYGLDTLLASDQSFTVWAPTNEAMASFTTDGSDVEHFLQNHINRYVYNASDLADTSLVRIKMLNGKFQDYSRSTGGYAFAGTAVAGASVAATNGLLHHIAGVAPFYLNLYEQIKSGAGRTDSLAAYIGGFDENTFDKSGRCSPSAACRHRQAARDGGTRRPTWPRGCRLRWRRTRGGHGTRCWPPWPHACAPP